jgi:hypothetical protein
MIDSRAIAWHVLLPEPVCYVTRGCSAPLTAALSVASSSDAPPALVVGDAADEVVSGDYDVAVWVNSIPSNAQLRRFAPANVRRYAALPSLADPRWYVPVDSPQHAAAALDLVSPYRPRARLLKALLQASARLGTLQGFRNRITIASRNPSQLDKFLVDTFGSQIGSVALAPGRFGDERKLIALALDRDAGRLAFVKIGFTPAAHEALVNEADWLGTLNRSHLLPTVPRLLGYRHHGMQTYVAIAPGPDRTGPKEFTRLHRDWLRSFQRLDQHDATFAASATASQIHKVWPRIRDSVTTSWQVRMDRVISRIQGTLGDHPLPLTAAHGDFAPWNTRLDPSAQLFVFDWEDARSDCIPLYDVFHFQFMIRVALTGGLLPADVSQWLPKAIMPHVDWSPPAPLVPALFGAFLVDLALKYLAPMAGRGIQEDDLVLSAVAPLLDDVEAWWSGR